MTARDGHPLEPGRIFVAPRNRHLRLDARGRIRVTAHPRKLLLCPSADLLFASVAAAAGRNAIGIVLSGEGADGSAGLAAIHAAGGFTIVQDPDDALCAPMPSAALLRVTPDAVLPASRIGPMLLGLLKARGPGPKRRTVQKKGLHRRRVLVAEDRFLLSAEIVLMLRDLGCDTVGPAADVGSGFRLLERGGEIDAAVLAWTCAASRCSGWRERCASAASRSCSRPATAPTRCLASGKAVR